MHKRPQHLTTGQLTAVVAGNALEFYDFLVFSFFAIQIGQVFFPGGSDTASLLKTLAVFGAGFLTRPLGGLVIGPLSDRIGRKPCMLLTFAPRSSLTLRGQDALKSYFFNTHKIEHLFCTTCGVEPFAFATAPDGTPSAAINLRCVPAVDLDALEIQRFDGASR